MGVSLRVVPTTQTSARVDAELVEATRAGDDQAFGELVERYQTLVSAVAFALTGDLVRSEELAQEVFFVAWSRLSELREPDRFRSWLYGIARNINRRHPHAHFKEIPIQSPLLDEAEIASAEPSALDRIIGEEELAVLQKALARIPETYRMPLVLFYRHEQSLERVAAALDLNVEAVGIRLTRGRRMLHEQVLRLLESALSTPRPRKRFVAAVVAAIAAAPANRPASASEAARPSGASAVPALKRLAAITISAAVCSTVYFVVAHRPAGLASGRSPAGAASPAATAPRAPLRGPGLAETPGPPVESDSITAKTVIFNFDFEDGILPALFDLGHVGSGPPGSAGRPCVMGTILVGYPQKFHVSLRDQGSPIFFYDDSLVLSFDYWIGDDYRNDDPNDAVSVQLYDENKGQNYHFRGIKPAYEVWTHVALPLTTFVETRDRSRRMEPGDAIVEVTISGGWTGGKPLYVDNLKLARAR